MLLQQFFFLFLCSQHSEWHYIYIYIYTYIYIYIYISYIYINYAYLIVCIYIVCNIYIYIYNQIYILYAIYIYIYIYDIKWFSRLFSYGHFYWEYTYETLVPFEVISSGCNALVVPFQQLLEGPIEVLFCERVHDPRRSLFHLLNCLITTASKLRE